MHTQAQDADTDLKLLQVVALVAVVSLERSNNVVLAQAVPTQQLPVIQYTTTGEINRKTPLETCSHLPR
jgi:hypothetical protein